MAEHQKLQAMQDLESEREELQVPQLKFSKSFNKLGGQEANPDLLFKDWLDDLDASQGQNNNLIMI